MIIKKIELKHYKRLMLNDIKFFRLTPENKVQLILGSNGSGKSSLLKELSPLPAINKEYKENGYKLIVIEHDNSVYELKSDFTTKTPFYSFIKDEEELNPSGTITTYKDLVNQNFNITNDVHDLMTGKTLFHNMSISERRAWFTRISDVDYTYAIRYYNKLKEKLRDISGAIKLSKSRLLQETDKLLDEQEIIKLKKERKTLNEVIDILLNNKTNITNDYSTIASELNTVKTSIEAISGEILSNGSVYTNLSYFSDADSLRMSIMGLIAESDLLKIDNKKLYEEIKTKQDTIKVIDESNIGSINEVDSKLDKLINETNKLNKLIKHTWTKDNPSNLLEALMSIKPTITELTNSLPNNEERILSVTNYNKLKEEYTSLEHKHKEIDRRINMLNKRIDELEHLKSHNALTCPECQHKWIKGYNANEHNKYLEDRAKLIQLEETVVKDLKNLETQIEECYNYLTTLKQLKHLTNNWKILEPLWLYISEKEYIYNNPNYIPILLDEVIEDLKLQLKISELNNDIKKLLEAKKTLDDTKETDKTIILKSLKELEAKVSNNLKTINSNEYKINKYKSYIKLLEDLKSNHDKLEVLLKQHKLLTDQQIESLKQRAINTSIRDLRIRLSEIENNLSRIENQKAIVENIEKDLKVMEDDLIIYKTAVKNLSPNEGLIAKGLQGFINNFVRQINNFISQVWLYPLELIPITNDEDKGLELDFKFNVRINDNIIIKDVNEGSSAMKEIIDLAFRIISMQYLGLDKAPLYLDEFGVKMDHSHRESAHYAITNLMNTSNFTQIYMVSHYESSYGSFKNADITVLNSSNIILPKDTAFNTKVEIC